MYDPYHRIDDSDMISDKKSSKFFLELFHCIIKLNYIVKKQHKNPYETSRNIISRLCFWLFCDCNGCNATYPIHFKLLRLFLAEL